MSFRAFLIAMALSAGVLLAAVAFGWPVTASYPNSAAQTQGVTTEVLVLNATATALPATPLVGRRSVEVQNLGPNAIDCAVGTAPTPTLTKSRRIAALGGVWALDVNDVVLIKCKAVTADQVTGAATIVTELK